MEKKIIDLIKMGFDLDKFYAIHFWERGDFDVQLQGRLEENDITQYIGLGFEFKLDSDMYTAQKNKVRIVLTK